MTRKSAKHTGYGKNKVSTVNLKVLYPQANNQRYSELEFVSCDGLNGDKPSLTWWEGHDAGKCEARWEMVVSNHRQLRFEIPGIPFKFIIVNGEIYYRRNVE